MKNIILSNTIFLIFAFIFNVTTLFGAPKNNNAQLTPVRYNSIGGKSTVRNSNGQMSLTTSSIKNGTHNISTTYRDRTGRVTQTSQTQKIGNIERTTYRDNTGKVSMTNRTHVHGNRSTTTFRDSSGRTAMTANSVTSGNTTRQTFRDRNGRVTQTATIRKNANGSVTTTYRDASGRVISTKTTRYNK